MTGREHSTADRVVSANRRLGGGLTAGGGVLVGVAYLLLPVASIPLIGSLTAPSLAGELPDAGSLTLLRLVPLTSVVMLGVGLWLVLARTGAGAAKVASAVVVVCAVLTALAYLMPYGELSREISGSGAEELGISATTFTGSGFWCALLGAVVAAAGAVVVFTGARASVPRGESAA
ncbi:hypothetical protein [Pseudonocardia spinosispora]|uniref:hypothetical protein n=1 Tax=Pseudonocardia spinosispora TaxID=103441 RepID=UPI000425A9D9|nr:hypothetical protein [Pseudonocardia spinosispora]